MVIRDFKKEDTPACLYIIKKTLTDWDVEQAEKDFTDENSIFRFVIEEENKVIGFMGYYTPSLKDASTTYYDEYLYNIEEAVCLDWVAILHEYQKQKLGVKIVEYCENHARNSGKKYMATWTVIPDFFKKCGYTKAVGYNDSEDSLYNCILMIKAL